MIVGADCQALCFDGPILQVRKPRLWNVDLPIITRLLSVEPGFEPCFVELQSWLGRSGVSFRLQVWGPSVIRRPFLLQRMPRVAGPTADSRFQGPERGSCCSSCLGLAANHIWEWLPHTPVITTVALKQLAAVLFAHVGGGFLEPPPLAGLCLTLLLFRCRPSSADKSGSAWRIPAKAPTLDLGRWLSPPGMRMAHLVGRPSPSLRWPTCLRGRMVPPHPHQPMLVAPLAQAMGDQICA